MDAMLDAFSLIANVTYIGFFIAATLSEYRDKTIGGLIKACQRYWTAVALAVVVLVINLADAPNDGWLSPAINAVTLAACITCAVLAGRKRDAKVIEEMQRDLGRES